MVRIKVKSVVEARGWDVKDLAYHADIGMSTAYRLMQDSEYDETTVDPKAGPSIVVLKRVAKALGVKLSDLIDEDRTPVASSDTWTALTMQRAAS